MGNILRNLDWSVLTDALINAVPVLICITLHECAHGYTALKLGDTTARDMGRLSLNPFKHFDFIGFVMMVFLGFGWAKPVPIDMRRFKHPKRDMAVSAAAGPLCNVLITVVSLFLCGLLTPLLYRPGRAVYYLYLTIQQTAYLSLAFAVFNILPIPPLDGSKVLYSVIPEGAYWKLMRYERYGMLLLLLLVVTGVLSGPLNRAVSFLFSRLLFIAQWGFDLSNYFFVR